jgi:DNA invertase Pin-like site-specific DNA recombinase
MSAMAEMERGMISMRQKDVHQDRRDKGKVWGIDLGPKSPVDEAVRQRIFIEHNAGISYRNIAENLNKDAIPTAHSGEKWYASTVRNIFVALSKENLISPK